MAPAVGTFKQIDEFMSIYEPLFFEAGVDMVFGGHTHAYERSTPVYQRAGGLAVIFPCSSCGLGAAGRNVCDHNRRPAACAHRRRRRPAPAACSGRLRAAIHHYRQCRH